MTHAQRFVAPRRFMTLAALCAALTGVACSNDGGASSGGTGGEGSGNAAPCLDRPNQLPRPPQRGLPCDLLPPRPSTR